MKKALILLILPLLFFGQKKEIIKLNYPLKDFTRTTKSLKVIDLRKEKKLVDIVYRGDYYSFSFPTDDLSADIENWFEKNNKISSKSTNDIVLLIEDLNISRESKNNELFYFLDMKFSTFLKNDNAYWFLKRYDNVIRLDPKEIGGIPNLIVENIQKVLQNLMFETYRATPDKTPISEQDLYDYNEILKNNFPVFTKNKLKDGIYLDYQSFFNQTPIENYELVKNKGEVVKAMKGEEDKIPGRKIFIYVEKGKPFKNSQAGFLPLQKDEGGFYVMANKYILFPEEIKTSSYFFLFGAVGGIAAGIQFNVKYNQALKDEKYPIYIDFLNGEYSFVK